MGGKRAVSAHVILCCILQALVIFGFYQDDCKLKLDILRVIDYNRSYGRDVKAGFVWYNRSTRAINGSGYLLKDVGTDIQLAIQGYKFLSNEYRRIAMYMKVHLCQEAHVDRFGIIESFQKAANFKLECPIKKGFLRLTYATFNESKFPPHIQPGKYRGALKFYDGPNFLGEAHLDWEFIEIIKKWELPRIFDKN
ncbi:hypothetical protein ILUMI_02961 [Ignelater luminosus]|uniref:Uncharacterized protein n=1 Tax=Ignelater luminosus TaxID=2038154 RepID=A0A8K0DMS1_IGNLU|nr:hypothetical protein ILUMI_02961 [Ignelater luminosus]